MRSGMYYVLGLLLLLATVPMYRYILHRANRPDVPAQPRFTYLTSPPPPVRPPLQPPSQPLSRDELCEGGVVVRVRGNVYTQELTLSGSVRCAAGLKFD